MIHFCFDDTLKMKNAYQKKNHVPNGIVKLNRYLDTFNLETDIMNYKHGIESSILYTSDMFPCGDTSMLKNSIVGIGFISSYSCIFLILQR